MTGPSILITGGRLINPADGTDETADVLIRDGVVAEIGRITPPAGITRIDAEGCLVTPGLLDIHVHLRDPSGGAHRETIASGAAAAVEGGFTTVCCMPNTTPALDTPELVRYVDARARAANAARVFTVACATVGRAGEALAPMAALAEAGAVGFSDDGDVIADAAMMQKVLRTVAATGRCFMQHCQEPTLTRGGVMNAGPTATRLGLTGWPAIAEELIIERDLRLNRDLGARYHAQHLSSGESVDLLRRARASGMPASGEVSPHHLLLTDEACDGYDTMAKMNPPLRTRRDIDLLKTGVADGTIDVLATDHAPHPPQRKATDFASAAFGIIGVECALPLYRQALIDDGVIDWPRMIAMMTLLPARLVGLDRRGLGLLRVSGPGDVTIIDPDLDWTVDVNAFASAERNCPFDGWAVRGRAVGVIVGGDVRLLRDASRRRGPSAPAASPAKR